MDAIEQTERTMEENAVKAGGTVVGWTWYGSLWVWYPTSDGSYEDMRQRLMRVNQLHDQHVSLMTEVNVV